ncbi:restriction endonuclease subunit S [Methanohalophilus sp.]|uniref:restriction endonuclease subunit S n=1 Tax=Methanohalophilus sp. TaxID=1966352 RepID=UPI00260501F4|nr:restriction endonuclease subunit S [Methanohalophilus sp.]
MKTKNEFKESETSKIPEGFHLITLGKLVTFQRGYDLPKKKRKKGNYPVVASNGIVDYHNEFRVEGAGVTIGRSGNLGEPLYIKQDYWPLNTTLYVKKFHNSDPLFVYYFLNTLDLKKYNSGSAVPSLNRNYIHPIKIIVPENIEEQKKISSFLRLFDDKIELNRRMNTTLEQIAQAIFKHWFIDFEFPDENGQPYRSSGGEMVDSELGEIPAGWMYKSAESIANVGIGKTPPRKQAELFSKDCNDVRWVSIRDMGESGTYMLDTSEYLTESAVNKFNVRVVPNNTVLLSFKLTIGRVVLTDGEMTTNEAIAHFKLTHEPYVSSEYLYLYLRNFDYERLGSTSSIAQAVNSKTIKSMPILVPQREVLNEFTAKISTIFEMIKSNQKESRNLAQMRDALLPKLISGKLRVNTIGKNGGQIYENEEFS